VRCRTNWKKSDWCDAAQTVNNVKYNLPFVQTCLAQEKISLFQVLTTTFFELPALRSPFLQDYFEKGQI